MKKFEHEWIFEAFVDHPTFFTKSMFGGLAAYLFDRLPASRLHSIGIPRLGAA
jgi:hypothetical protein